MYVADLSEMRERVQMYFQGKASYQGTYRNEGYVLFDMYQVFPFRFGFLDRPYTSLGIQVEIADGRATHRLLQDELIFIENREKDLLKAFEVVDRYCRLRLPDKFLEAFDAL